ncbi:hypothetical protein L1276_004873 [Flavobacterium sp. HSC-32F16]|uniref:hypothetical protein n=1 Tax=Flavobacterium sp. HSC-32F16 TaxID=2910964 RepID=UPI0020A3F712|nr:hypothetical protein [Flavobacterium sp. HSC-32F16]MCP2029679.1 hypothetical protein [Flavobacterium sp. HSC-32F16]
MKKYLFPGFWLLYMLFFAIPFPIMIYYAVNSEFDIAELKDKNPWLALSLVALSIILWLIVIIRFFQKWILHVFLERRNLEDIKRNGLIREAKIVSAVKISGSKARHNTYELELLFKNLADTEIIHKTEITDIKPHERRFETGKRLNLILNREPKKLPVFVLANSTAEINGISLILRVFGWLFVAALVTGYYFYSYQDESHGMGWRFMSFGHPLLVCALVLIFYRYLLKFILSKLTGRNEDSVLIKFKGIKTWAKLISVNQTGTYINEQPMMRFELEYTDNKHQVHRNNLKKIVGLLELDMTKKEQIEIFYLAENPNQIAFADDLNNMK